jgi:hypothetical protein
MKSWLQLLLLFLFIILTVVVIGATKYLLQDEYRWSSHDLKTFPVFSKGWYPGSSPADARLVHRYHLLKTEEVPSNFQEYVTSVLSSQNEEPRRLWIRLKSTKTKDSDISHLAFLLGLNNSEPIPTRPFVLITTDGDNTPQSACLRKEFDFLLSLPNLLRWYSQNCESDHPKMRPIPIGLDLHTHALKRSRLSTLRRPWTLLLNKSRDVMNQMDAIKLSGPSIRIQTILYDLGSSTHPERQSVRKLVENHSRVKSLNRREAFVDLWKMYSQFDAGISVRGNGLDCHRTWEMLYLGMIPILRRQNSAFDRLFDGLPVVFVDNWHELNDKDFMRRVRAVRSAYPKSTPFLHEKFWLE